MQPCPRSSARGTTTILRQSNQRAPRGRGAPTSPPRTDGAGRSPGAGSCRPSRCARSGQHRQEEEEVEPLAPVRHARRPHDVDLALGARWCVSTCPGTKRLVGAPLRRVRMTPKSALCDGRTKGLTWQKLYRDGLLEGLRDRQREEATRRHRRLEAGRGTSTAPRRTPHTGPRTASARRPRTAAFPPRSNKKTCHQRVTQAYSNDV